MFSILAFLMPHSSLVLRIYKFNYITRLSYHFIVEMARCNRKFYASSSFPRTSCLWNSLSASCFPVIFKTLNEISIVIFRLLNPRSFIDLSLSLIFSDILLDLVTSCDQVALLPYLWRPPSIQIGHDKAIVVQCRIWVNNEETGANFKYNTRQNITPSSRWIWWESAEKLIEKSSARISLVKKHLSCWSKKVITSRYVVIITSILVSSQSFLFFFFHIWR